MNHFRFVKVEVPNGVRIDRLNSNALFMDGSSVYRRVGKCNEGITIHKANSETVICININTGSLRAFSRSKYVEPLQVAEGTETRLVSISHENLGEFVRF